MHAIPLGQMVPFVHPAIAVIAAGTGLIPVIIHLINRRRYQRMPWAAMSFLLAAKRRSARRIAIEHWLLLLLRMLVVILFGLAIARPYLPAGALSPISIARSHHILLLDNSLSMQAKFGDGQSRFEVAMQFARNVLDRVPNGDAVSIVTMARPATAPVAHPAYDTRFVREQLSAIGVTQRATDVVGAITMARSILGGSDVPAGNCYVYAVSDFQQRDWIPRDAQGRHAALTPPAQAVSALARSMENAKTNLRLVVVGESEVENVSIRALRSETGAVAVGVPVRIIATVANNGSSTARGRHIELRRGGEILRRQELPPIPPDQTTTVAMSAELPANQPDVLEARLVGGDRDVLAVDDSRFLSLDAREAIPVLIVDGRPGSTPLTGESGYLVTALSPQAQRFAGTSAFRLGSEFSATSWLQPKVVTKARFEQEMLDYYDVIALCNVHRLGELGWKRLGEQIAKGRGLCIFAGDLIDENDYNQFGFADGSGPMPGAWQQLWPQKFAPESPGTTIDPSALNHPVVAAFEPHPSSGLFHALFTRYRTFEPDMSRATVALRYRTGHPALVAAPFEQGRILVFTSSAGMDWNNLPAKGDYVSLMINAFSYLAAARSENRNLFVGELLHEPLTPREAALPLQIQLVGEPPTSANVVPLDGGLAIEHGPLERSGPWRVAIGGHQRLFACNVEPGESDIRSSDIDTLRAAFEGTAWVYAAQQQGPQDPRLASAGELGMALLFITILLLLLECAVSRWFGAERSAPARQASSVSAR